MMAKDRHSFASAGALLHFETRRQLPANQFYLSNEQFLNPSQISKWSHLIRSSNPSGCTGNETSWFGAASRACTASNKRYPRRWTSENKRESMSSTISTPSSTSGAVLIALWVGGYMNTRLIALEVVGIASLGLVCST